MSYIFPWEVPKVLEDFFSGPCLFKALYRLYKGAYFGEGFRIIGNYPRNKDLYDQIDKLPLDIKRIIFSKFWKGNEEFNKIVNVLEGELFLDSSLHYLFLQYRNLKAIAEKQVPRIYAGWNGVKIGRKTYILTYGPINLLSTPLIPDFVHSRQNPPYINLSLKIK